MVYRLNERLAGMRCLQCGTVHPVADYFEGCPDCLAAGSPSSVAASFSAPPDCLATAGRRGCFGVDGFRTIAFELHEDIGADSIGAVLVPTSRADLLWGIARGFRDLVEAGLARSAPKVHAVEPFPRISAVLAGADRRDRFPGSSALVSIGGDMVTYQVLAALDLCGGTAVAVAEADAIRDRRLLAERGLYLELSSAAGLTGLREQGAVLEGETAVLIATSHGFKEEGAFDQGIPIVG